MISFLNIGLVSQKQRVGGCFWFAEVTRRNDNTPVVNQTPCHIYEIRYTLPEAPCDRCGQPAPYLSLAGRTAIDIHLEQPVLLYVTVSIHHCQPCAHFFRVQPPFLRADAIYTNRVVAKAVQSVYEDGMAIRRTALRLARDFWVQPSEKIIRAWCRAYSTHFNFESDYQPWVVNAFSGVLCVDEVYQGQLALLLAVDPAAPEGDRLVGYQLVTGSVTAEEMEAFLRRLKAAGISPDQVVTDGSTLYPTVLSKVWPTAVHQLCLFHETRRVTGAVMKLINSVRKNLPEPPPSPERAIRSRRSRPLSASPNPATPDPQAVRNRQIAWVHHLAEQGLSQRAIARQTGFHRLTVREWLQMERPVVPLAELPDRPATLPLPISKRRAAKRAKIRQAQEWAGQGLSYCEIGRRLGIHRTTIAKWVAQALPSEEEEATPPEPGPTLSPAPPPAPWQNWEQVRQVRELLKEHRFVLLKRPENLDDQEQAHLAALLISPAGAKLQVGRDFLVDWYRIWGNETGQRRTPTEAQACYEAWHANETYRTVPVLNHLQQRVTATKFEQMSQFLHQPAWEATNNGAERAGRAFRHRQAPHFNLRGRDTIAASITVTACLQKEAVTATIRKPLHTCQRGRKTQTERPRHAGVMEFVKAAVGEVRAYA
jgi:transposase